MGGANAYDLLGNGDNGIVASLRVLHEAHFIENRQKGVKHADLIFAAWDAKHTAPVCPFNFEGYAAGYSVTLLQERFLILRENGDVANQFLCLGFFERLYNGQGSGSPLT